MSGTPAPSTLTRHFDELFASEADPWGYRTRWYEQRKRQVMLACLPQPRYARAFEPACASGELSAALAGRCDCLLATDGSAPAVAHARRRLADLRHVHVAQASMPGEWPEGRFDLVVLSEFGYYLETEALDAVGDRGADCLAPGGTVLACHWRHAEGDYQRLGDEVHRRLHERLHTGHGLARLLHHEEADFLIDVWSLDMRSVAQREGIAR